MLALGLDLVTPRMVGGFSPLALFAASEAGAWYDTSDVSTLFQDSAGTIPAAVDQPVGLMRDKSGRGNHVSTATTSTKPILRSSGTVTNYGLYSQQLNNGVWATSNATVTPDFAAGPDGVVTADRIAFPAVAANTGLVQQSAVAGAAGGRTWTVSAYVKRNGGADQPFRLKCTHTGVTDYYSPDKIATSEFQRFVFTQAFAAGASAATFGIANSSTGAAADLIVRDVQILEGVHADGGPVIPTTDTIGKYVAPGSQYYLEHDGVDDRLQSTNLFDLTTTYTRISALRQITWTNVEYLLGGAQQGATAVVTYTASPGIAIFDGVVGPTNNGLAVGATGIVTERHTGNAGASLAVNNGAYTVGDAGVQAGQGVSIGGPGHDPSGHSNIRFYGLVTRAGAMTDADIAKVRAALAAKSGVVL